MLYRALLCHIVPYCESIQNFILNIYFYISANKYIIANYFIIFAKR